MRHYRREIVDSRAITEKVRRCKSIVDMKGLVCPECGKPLRWHSGEPDERHMMDGTFESIELYECEDCNVRVRVTQVYAPVTRTVSAEKTIWED